MADARFPPPPHYRSGPGGKSTRRTSVTAPANGRYQPNTGVPAVSVTDGKGNRAVFIDRSVLVAPRLSPTAFAGSDPAGTEIS
jgi:hypothetical protein